MSAFERLGRALRAELDGWDAAAGTRARQRAELLAAVGAAPALRGGAASDPLAQPRAGWLRAGVPLMAAIAVLALAAAALLRPAAKLEPALTARALDSGNPARAGQFLEAAAAPLRLGFSDGTRVELAPRARARLVALDSHGAHVALESGRVHLEVRHAPRTAWQLSAGPFLVRVTGTRFDVSWSPESDAFELDLAQGSVQLSGCAFGPGYAVRAGQRVQASCKQPRFDVRARDAAPQSTPVVQPAGTAVRATAVPAGASRAGAALVAFRGRSQRGDYAGAFALAQAAGFEALCARAGAHELSALADAARYAGDSAAERLALRSLRRRFAGSSQAATAAFALGRLEFDRHGSYPEAAQWFETYLKEQARGPLRREARGRLIEALLRAGERARAAALASAYLRDYPRGPHAAIARSSL